LLYIKTLSDHLLTFHKDHEDIVKDLNFALQCANMGDF
jgi:hypothetical protein